MLRPADEADLAEAVASAAAARRPLEITGGGTRRPLGRPVQAADTLSTAGLSGIHLYEPGALTLVVGAGTPLAEIEDALSAEGQRLPFEPMDHRALLGTRGTPTVGGVVACGVSGPRRIQAGACRDAMLGLRYIDGGGRVIRNGGRVMKNVTGYDLVKLLCGSYGTLGVLSEVAFKVLPTPERRITVVLQGLDDAMAVAALSAAMATPFDVTGAAHLPAEAQGDARTLMRVEGLADQAAYRARALAERLVHFGAAEMREGPDADADWVAVRDCTAFAGRPGAVWRLSVRPSAGPGVVAALADVLEVAAIYDWSGGLVWLLVPEQGDAGAALIRAEVAARGGHATLVRASDATRTAVPVFQPEPGPLAAISAGLRARFDPHGVLNPGRMAA